MVVFFVSFLFLYEKLAVRGYFIIGNLQHQKRFADKKKDLPLVISAHWFGLVHVVKQGIFDFHRDENSRII